MEDLSKNAETEKSTDMQTNSNKVVPGSALKNAAKVPVKRNRVKAEPNPADPVLTKSVPAAKTAVEIQTTELVSPIAAKPILKREKKTVEKMVVKKAPKIEKTKAEPIVKRVVSADSKEIPVTPVPVKKEPKSIEKRAKKFEEKVDKLKKKVKKAKKKEVKKSKLKSLKEKLRKALDKFKRSVKKLQETKK